MKHWTQKFVIPALCLLAFALVLRAESEPTSDDAAPANTERPLTPYGVNVEELSPEDREAAFIAMGWTMAQNLSLDVGFTEDELVLVFEGMRDFAAGQEEPVDIQAFLPMAQAIFMDKHQQVLERLRQEAAKEAEKNIAEAETYFAELSKREGVMQTESGLYYEILDPGSDEKVAQHDDVLVLYTGRLIDGTEFDSSTDRENPAVIPLYGVIRGFSEGLQLIGTGGKIRLHIPQDLGYGSTPQEPDSIIRPGSALIFEAELVGHAVETTMPPPPMDYENVQPPPPTPPEGRRPPEPPPSE